MEGTHDAEGGLDQQADCHIIPAVTQRFSLLVCHPQ